MFDRINQILVFSQDFTLDLFMRQRWNDPRLAYKDGLESYTIMAADVKEIYLNLFQNSFPFLTKFNTCTK